MNDTITPIAEAVSEAMKTEDTNGARTYLALPRDVKGLLEQRKSPQKATLNDQVETLYIALYENQEFIKLREPVYREQAVEGDLRDDDTRAAMMIRDEAKRKGNLMVAKEKLAVLRHAMFVVERRYNVSRTQRLALSEA